MMRMRNHVLATAIGTTVVNSLQLDCEQCIDRSKHVIRAIYHGETDDPFWSPIESAAIQAGITDFGVDFQTVLYDSKTAPYSPEHMAADIRRAIDDNVDAIVTTLSAVEVENAVSEAVQAGIAVFGLNAGYKQSQDLRLAAMVAQDEYLGGQYGAQRFMETLGNRTNLKVLFTNHAPGNAVLIDRYGGFRDEILQQLPDADIVEFIIDVDEPVDDRITKLQSEIGDCSYDIIMGGGQWSGMHVLQAIEDLERQCQETQGGKIPLVGTFDTDPAIYNGVSTGELLFAIYQQPHLQAVIPILLASTYVATGQIPALPFSNAYRIYMSGPTVIDQSNVPSDTLQSCADEGFPEGAECHDRSNIRLAGVLHGVMTDSFWDLPFAASKQAAIDMGIQLDLERFDAPDVGQSDEILYQQMAAKIRSVCDSNVDGLFVTLPSQTVADAVQYCQTLKIPVVSVNSGADSSAELGLMHHVGQLETVAGYEAGQRMIDEGVKQGWCIVHEATNVALQERCNGMKAAFVEANGDAEYMDTIEVPRDNSVVYRTLVEEAVSNTGGDKWDGVGLLFSGAYIDIALEILEDHAEVVAGLFDVDDDVFVALDEHDGLVFAIHQQPYLQGYLPIPLLTYFAYSREHLVNEFIETGPSFHTSAPSEAEVQCEANLYAVCEANGGGQHDDDGPRVGLIVGLVIGSLAVVIIVVVVAFAVKFRSNKVDNTDDHAQDTNGLDIHDTAKEVDDVIPADWSGVILA